MDDNSGYSITHSVPAAMLAKLGDVLASFALVEQSLKHLVGTLASADPNIGAVVIAEAPTRVLRWMAVSLYRVHFGEDAQFAELVALTKRAATAEEERNQIAHSHWDGHGWPWESLPGDSVVRIKITAKDALKFKRETLSADDLHAMARRMDDVARDLWEFWRLNVGRTRRRFATQIADTVPADEIKPTPKGEPAR